MTGEERMFQCLTPMHGGTVTFEVNQKGKIAGVGNIRIDSYLSNDNVLFVKRLKHKNRCVIQHKNGTQLFTSMRKGNLYKINLSELSNQNATCLLSIKGNHWV